MKGSTIDRRKIVDLDPAAALADNVGMILIGLDVAPDTRCTGNMSDDLGVTGIRDLGDARSCIEADERILAPGRGRVAPAIRSIGCGRIEFIESDPAAKRDPRRGKRDTRAAAFGLEPTISRIGILVVSLEFRVGMGALLGPDRLAFGRTIQIRAGRARNRRVEIVIRQGLGEGVKDKLEILRAEDPVLYEEVRQELIERFELSPDEIF